MHVFARHMTSHVSTCLEWEFYINGRSQTIRRRKRGEVGKEKRKRGKERMGKEKRKRKKGKKRKEKEGEGVKKKERTKRFSFDQRCFDG